MKRFYALAAMTALLALGSCQKTEVINESPLEIKFGAEIGKQTKAKIAFDAPDFGVFGYVNTEEWIGNENTENCLFDNIQYTKQNNEWKPQDDKLFFWPANGNEMVSFFAYSPWSNAGNVTFDVADGLTFNFPTTGNNDGSIDFMYSTPLLNQTYEDNINGVNLVFNHAMSQILFTVKTDENYIGKSQFKLESIVLKNIESNGIFTSKGDNNVWRTNTPAQKDYIFYNETTKEKQQNITKDVVYVGGNATRTKLYMIPQDATNLDFEIKYLQYDVEGTNVIQDITRTGKLALDWLANQRITYNVTISSHEITFNPQIEDWTDVPHNAK